MKSFQHLYFLEAILVILLAFFVLYNVFLVFGQSEPVHDSVFCESYYLNNDFFNVPNDCLKYDLKNYCSVYLESNVKDIPYLCFDYFTSLKK